MRKVSKQDFESIRGAIERVNAEILKIQAAEIATAAEARKRRQQARAKWKKLLESSPIDMSRILELCKKDEQRAAAAHKEAAQRFGTPSAKVLARARDIIAANEGVIKLDPPDYHPDWLYLPIDGVSGTGNCGDRVRSDTVRPYALTKGRGSGFDSDDEQSATARCKIMSGIPFVYLPSDVGQLFWVNYSVFVDIHGWYEMEASDGIFTSDNATIDFNVQVGTLQSDQGIFTPQDTQYTASQSLISGNADNINQIGRLDFTGYLQFPMAAILSRSDEIVQISIDFTASLVARGGGSVAALDFLNEGGQVQVCWAIAYFTPVVP